MSCDAMRLEIPKMTRIQHTHTHTHLDLIHAGLTGHTYIKCEGGVTAERNCECEQRGILVSLEIELVVLTMLLSSGVMLCLIAEAMRGRHDKTRMRNRISTKNRRMVKLTVISHNHRRDLCGRRTAEFEAMGARTDICTCTHQLACFALGGKAGHPGTVFHFPHPTSVIVSALQT